MSTHIGCIVFAAVVVGGCSTTLKVGREVTLSPPDELCWRSLTPNAGPQDLGVLMTGPAVAAVGPSEAWLSWQGDDARILRWFKGQWTWPPVPLRVGVDGMWNAVLAASPSGRVVVAVSANGEDGISALHIARATDGSWEWLGAPLISSREPFTHAQEATIALLDGERPVVAWSEERDVQLAGLFVARWDGSSWTRLGALNPGGDDYTLSPALAIDVHKQVWLSWNEGRRGGVRVARWDGSAWRDIGRDTLERLAADQGVTPFGELSLAVDEKGHAWLLRLVSVQGFGARLALARWDGANWATVPEPRGPAGKESTAASATMILRNDVPTIAWSQADASDNHYLYVSEWAAGDRWVTRLAGLHLVEGFSHVTDVRLAAGDARSFFVSFDESGNDGRLTRLVQVYTCAADETPAAPPRSVVERDTWPTTVDEAAQRLVAALDDESKARLRATRRDQLSQYNFYWGRGIRNSLGLWRGNEKLLESCGQVGPEGCSMVIIEAVWTLVQAP